MDSGNYELNTYFSYEKGGIMADGGEIFSKNNKTGETYSVVSGSIKKSDDDIEDGTSVNVRNKYSSRISESQILFDKYGNLYSIIEYGYTTDGTNPSNNSRSGRTYRADKKETLDVLSKKYSPVFAKKLIEVAKNYKSGGMMADGGMTHGMSTVNEIGRLSGVRPIAIAEWGDKNNINLSIVLKDLKSKKIKGIDIMTAIVGNPNNKYQKELLATYSKMASGGKVTFTDKVKSIKSRLLKGKKVSPKVQKDYGKTYSPAEAEDSAKRIVGSITAKERLMNRMKKSKK